MSGASLSARGNNVLPQDVSGSLLPTEQQGFALEKIHKKFRLRMYGMRNARSVPTVYVKGTRFQPCCISSFRTIVPYEVLVAVVKPEDLASEDSSGLVVNAAERLASLPRLVALAVFFQRRAWWGYIFFVAGLTVSCAAGKVCKYDSVHNALYELLL